LNIIFAGTPDFAATALEKIHDSRHVVETVLTQPDRPAGRGRKLTPSAVKQLALGYGLPVYQPETLKNDDVVETLRELNADVMVVVAYGLILPQKVLATPRLGCINIHASLLPRWRGAAPIQRAIMAGDRETGATIIQMDAGLDTGAMLVRVPCAISETDTGGSLHDTLAALGADAVLTALDQLDAGNTEAQPQDDSHACYAKKMTKDESWLDWSDSAVALARKIRAFTPWPSARTLLDGEPLHIKRAEIAPDSILGFPGTVVVVSQHAIDISTGDGTLRLLEVQRPGARPVSVVDFLNSRTLPVGTVLTGKV